MIKETNEGCLLDIEVKPHSDKFEVEGLDPWQDRIKIRIKSLPLKGMANKELIREMKEITGSDIEIVKGEKSTKKTLLIRTSKKELKKRLDL